MNKEIIDIYFEKSKSVNHEELSYSLGRAWLLSHGFKYLYNGFRGFEAWRGWMYVRDVMYSVLVRWRCRESKYLWRVDLCQSKDGQIPLVNKKELSSHESDILEYSMRGLAGEVHWALQDGTLTTRRVDLKELDFPRRMLALHMHDDEPERSDSCVPELIRKEA